MRSPQEAKTIIERIRNEIEACKETYIWRDYLNSLDIISHAVFPRSGFILELIQNAEDAGVRLPPPGEFQIRINQKRIKVTNDGHPFTEEDVKALCGIRSSKKPELGTLGYLGIGFKSVFKVTDSPEVYSGGFQFKFDGNAWSDRSNTPWHVLPIWVEEPSQKIPSDITTFILPLREESDYETVLSEIEKLTTALYLFLRWLKTIEITDEVSGTVWTLQNQGETEENIVTLKRIKKTKAPSAAIYGEIVEEEQRFKLFTRTSEIPDWLKQDPLVRQYRRNVRKREIVIAFAIDRDGDLEPTEARAMYGGVYSFLPLSETTSGAPFAIQADFLAVPGRSDINYDAKWNQWLVERVTDLCKDALIEFKRHERWKFQFLPAFDFTKDKGHLSYEKLFGPKLVQPLEEFIEQDNCVPTADGGWAKPSEVVKLAEDEKARQDLVGMRILAEEQIAPVLGGQQRLKVVHPRVRERPSKSFTKVDRHDLLKNKNFLQEKCQQPSAAEWFRSLYLWLAKHPRRDKFGRPVRYHDVEFVLTADAKLLKGGEVWLPDLPPSDPLIGEVAKSLQESRAVLHPDVLGGPSSKDEQQALRSFLLGFTGVQVLNAETVCKEALLPRILTTAPKPPADVLIEYTRRCQQILGPNLGPEKELWVLTKEGHVTRAKEVIFPKQFAPPRDWETNQHYLPGLHFVSPDYLSDETDPKTLQQWRQFFKAAGVKEDPDNGVEEFAINYAKENLRRCYKTLTDVQKRNPGYDLEAEKDSGERNYIEVKGRTTEEDIELTREETQAAYKHGEFYHLYVVAFIPELPDPHMVGNPYKVGKTEKLTIPARTWKDYPPTPC